MTKILGMGNALVDVVTMIEDDNLLNILSLPKGSMQLVDKNTSNIINQKTLSFSKSMVSGGSAANTIRGISMLGMPTGFLGKVGNDELGDFFRKDMEKSGVAPMLIKENNHEGTGQSTVLVSPDSERTMATYLGVAASMHIDDISENEFKNFDIFHIEGYLVQNNELIEKAVSLAKKNNQLVSLDLASYNIVEDNLDFLTNLISKYVDVVFANEEEAKAFYAGTPQESLDYLSSLCDIAIVKVGAKGSILKSKQDSFKVDAIKANCVDTTGAGDYYASGFLYGLANKWGIEKSAKAGSIISGNVVEVIGAAIKDDKWSRISLDIANL